MTLAELSRQGLIRHQATSPEEIEGLWKLVARDLANAKVADLSGLTVCYLIPCGPTIGNHYCAL